MHSRDPDYTITIGGDHLVLLPAYGPAFVTDLDRGRRYATIEILKNFVKLIFASPWLHHSGGTICEPVDLPVTTRHLDMTYAHLRYSLKPFMGAVTAPERAEDSLHMARIVFGDAFMETHCVIQGNINVNSPLALLNAHTPGDLIDLRYFHHLDTELFGHRCTISRTGYSGERGYEIFVPASAAGEMWDQIIGIGADMGVMPASFTALDEVRIEAALPIYGPTESKTHAAESSTTTLFSQMIVGE